MVFDYRQSTYYVTSHFVFFFKLELYLGAHRWLSWVSI